MKRVLITLHNTRRGYFNYIGKAVLISTIPAIVLAVVLSVIIPNAKAPELKGSIFTIVIGVLIISPWVETLLMWLILRILKFFLRNLNYLALSSALIWALLHSLFAPIWGLIIFWSVFVLSTSFLEWEKKSKFTAVWVTATIHMCQNSLVVLAIVLEGTG